MELIKIDEAEIILQDLGDSQGKLIVAHPWYNGSTYWGAMGGTLKEFLMRINEDYFTGRLSNSKGVINMKSTMRDVRKAIREELPWYKDTEFQKELREKLNDIQSNCENDHQFVDAMNGLPESLMYYDLESYKREKEIKQLLKDILSEPWHYIVHGESPEQKFYRQLHKKLVKHLKKEKK